MLNITSKHVTTIVSSFMWVSHIHVLFGMPVCVTYHCVYQAWSLQPQCPGSVKHINNSLSLESLQQDADSYKGASTSGPSATVNHNGVGARVPLPFLYLTHEINEPCTGIRDSLLWPACVLELLHWERRAILQRHHKDTLKY